MCGRFALALTRAQLEQAFPGISFPADHRPRFNIAPGQTALVIPNDGHQQAAYFYWGFPPTGPAAYHTTRPYINARAETAYDRPAFRTAFRYHRCLIPASGFFEWQTLGTKKRQPWYFHPFTQKPLALGGLWTTDEQANAPAKRYRFLILTLAANPDVAPIHPRMPLILPHTAWDIWLQPGEVPLSALLPLLLPPIRGYLQAYPVLDAVNNPQNDSPRCLLPRRQGN